MGTQQILLIVLSVIIVGIAVAVGITMFNQQAENSNRNACLADLNMFASQATSYFKTPQSHGGAGSDVDNVDISELSRWIGFSFENDADGTDGETGNGSFLMEWDGTSALSIEATGNEGTDPKLKIDFATTPATITTVITGELPS